MSVNPIRAELLLTFKNGEEYKARMSLDTVMRIEQKFKTTILKLGKKLQESDLQLIELISIVTLALRSGGNDFDEKKVTDLCASQSYVANLTMVGELIALALDAESDNVSNEKKS